jgi:hypothetical protein
MLTLSIRESWYFKINSQSNPRNKITAFYPPSKFTAFATAHHLSVSSASWIESTPSSVISLRSSLILSYLPCIDLQNGLFPSHFPTKTMHSKACTNFRNESCTSKEGKSVHKHFSRPQPKKIWPQSPIFLFVWTRNNPVVFSSNLLKWKDTSPKYFWWQSNCTQPPEVLRKSAAVREHTRPCMSWFRWRIFWTFLWIVIW